MAKGIIIQITGDGAGAAEALRLIEEKMQETAEHSKGMAEDFREAGEKITHALESIGLYWGLEDVIEKIKETVKETIDFGVEIGHLSEQTGISAQNLSVLKYAAGATGIEFESFVKAFKKLSTTFYEAENGSKLSKKAFEDLGISEEQLKAHATDMYGLMGLIADRFKAMPDGIQKNALATQALGRGGQQLIPILNEGAEGLERFRDEAQEMGVVLDDAGVKRMEEVHRSTEQMKEAFQGLALEITGDLAPALKEAASAMSMVLQAIRIDSADTLRALIGTVLTGGVPPSLAANIAEAQHAEQIRANSSAASDEANKAPNSGAMPGSTGWQGDDKNVFSVNVAKLTQDQLQAHADMVDRMNAEANASERALEAFENQIDAQQELAPFVQAVAAAQKQAADYADYQARIAEQGQAIDQALLQQQAHKDDGKESGLQNAAKDAGEAIGRMADQLMHAASGGKNAMRDLKEEVIKDLEEMASKILEKQFIGPLLQKLFSFIPGIGGTSDSQIAQIDSQGIIGSAGGGDISSGLNLVGEGGPELFMPSGPGTILPNELLSSIRPDAGSGGSTAPNVTINNVNQSSNPVQMKQTGVSWDSAAREFVIHTVLEDWQQGGPVSQAMKANS